MAMIKRPESATLPASDVGKPEVETKTEPKAAKKLKVESAKEEASVKDELDLRGKIILAQNACGNVISSAEWATVSLQCKDEAERNAKFEKTVRHYFDLCVTLAGE